MKIFQYLIEKKSHPTVDEIYRALSKEVLTLSKTTIYNTLNLFIEKGITKVITIEENETRYDALTDIHGHFKCEVCETIFDIPVLPEHLMVSESDKFKINEYHIYFKGICHKCQNIH